MKILLMIFQGIKGRFDFEVKGHGLLCGRVTCCRFPRSSLDSGTELEFRFGNQQHL
jgi:hypothetical protein